MATDTVLVSKVIGKAWMRADDGSMIPVHEGMRVPVNAHIVTDNGSQITLLADGVPPITIGETRDVVLSDDMLVQPEPNANAVTSPTDPQIGQVLAALESGQDPFANLDATAAVLTGGDGGGSSFSRLVSIIESTSPLALAYPRGPLDTPEDVVLSGDGFAAADALPPSFLPPTINIPDHNDGDLGVVPGMFTLPEGFAQPMVQLAAFASPTTPGVEHTFSFTAQAGLSAIQFTFDHENGTPVGGAVPAVSESKSLTAAQLGALSETDPFIVDTDRGLLALTGYDAVTGTITYRYWVDGAQDHSQGDGESVFDTIKIEIIDSQGSTATADLVANITDMAPTAFDDTGSISEGALLDVAAFEGVLVNDTLGADGATVVGVAKGTDVATDVSGGIGGVGIAGVYGTLILNADGSYTYQSTANAITAGATDSFVYTVKDGDGDLSTTTLTINVSDVTLRPDTQHNTGTVDEAALDTSTTGNDLGHGTVTGSAPSSALETVDGQLAVAGTGVTYGAISQTTAHGIFELSTDGKWTYTLTNPYDTTPDADDGMNVEADKESFTYTATDANGNTVTGTVLIDITDDVPTAVADIDSIAAGVFTAATGNVLTGVDAGAGADANTTDGVADTQGADGAVVVGVAKGTTNTNLDSTGTLNTAIDGTYGKLTLHADGSYSYVRNAGSAGGVNDVFTYTIKDSDGDLSHTTLTIGIGNSTPTLDGLTPQVNGGDVTVYESALATGSDSSSNNESATGTFTLTSPDGVSLTIGGQAFITAGVFTAGSLTTPDGNTLAVTGYDAGTGVVSYTYTLLDNEAHANVQGNNNLFENLAVVVTDADGDHADGTLTVTIVDDVPVAVADIDSIAAGVFTPATGNVLTGVDAGAGADANTTDGVADTQGADGAVVVGVAKGHDER